MENNDVVIIQLDRPRTLRLSHKVLKRFSASQKIGMMDLEKAIQRYDVLSNLIYEMLRADDETITVEQCDELLDDVSIAEITQKCADAISAAFGDPEADPMESRRSGTGTSH